MWIESVHSSRVNTYTNNTGKDREQASGIFTEGQIISGTITKVSEQVTLDFEGKQVDFPKNAVKNPREGEVRSFQVLRANEKGITLKELGTAEETKTAVAGFTQVDATAGAVVKEKEEIDEQEEEEDPEELAERMTEEDYLELASEGFTLEGYNLERLARALERIKAGRIEKQENLADMAAKQVQVREELRRISEKSVPGAEALTEYLVQLFVQADIPVTEERVEEAVQAVRLGAQTGSLNDGAKAYLIRNEQEPSVDNLYRAVHSGERGNVQAMPEDTWEQLQPAVQSVLEQVGRTADVDGLADARWLLERDIPLTPENIAYKQELDELQLQQTPETILDQVGKAWQRGDSAGQALLGATPKQLQQQTQVRQYQQEFAAVTPEAVDAAVEALQTQGGTGELSLAFLKKIQEQLGDQTLSIQDISARRQLAEIQLKLTMENGVKLLERGIRPDTDSLEKIVDGLRSIEQEYYEKLYREAGGVVNDTTRGDIELLARTCSTVAEVKEQPAYLLGATFTERHIQTLDGLAAAGRSMTAEFARAEQTYEAVMTKPRADMGDSIATAFRNMDSLMQELGLEPVEANRRAIRILSYNQMELSEENIQEMKLYDAKVQQLLDGLNPAAAVRMIRQDINPLELPIDELNTVLRQMKEEGTTTEEKYSNYLVKLDQAKELTPEERSSYIGIYRLLHQVVKNDGAALGAVINSGREVTLANLLSAVRTRKGGGIDAGVNDAFGGLTGLERKGTDILEQAGTAFSYQQLVAEQILERLSPRSLSAVKASGAEPEQMPLEQLQEVLAATEHTAEEQQYAQVKLAQLNTAVQDSAEEQAFLDAFRQEKSVAMLQAAKELLGTEYSRKRLYAMAEKYQTEYTQADETEAGAGLIAENSENMKKQVEKMNQSADKIIDELFEGTALSGEDSMQLVQLRNTIRLTGQLAEREFYEIPLQGERGFVKMNLTVRHQTGQSGNVSIHLKQEQGEDVQVELSITEKTVQGYVTTASRAELEQLQQSEAAIRAKLEQQGFEVAQWNYGLKTRSADSYIYKDGSIYRRSSVEAAEAQESGVTRTDDLYLAAKTVIQAVSAE